MKKVIKYAFAILFGMSTLMSCEDDNVTAPGPYAVADAPSLGTLKALAQAKGLKIGNILSYSDLSNPQKLDLIKREFDNVTFGYEMKHGAIVQDDGSLNFSKADEMMAWAKENGLGVYGHTLIWHQNQNATYLNMVAQPPGSMFYGPNLVANSTMDENIDGWNQMNPNPAGGCGPRIAQGEGRNGTKGLYVDGTCSAITAADYWRVQIGNTLTGNMVAGATYRIEFWIKAKVAGNIQFEIRGGKADGDNVVYIVKAVTTEWSKVVIDHTALGTEGTVGGNILTFDLNNANHTEYWIDDMAVYQYSTTPINMVANPTMNENIDTYNQMNPNPAGGCGPRIAQGEGRNGTKGLYVDGTCSAITAADYWRVQIGTTLASSMEAGNKYLIEFYIKAKAAGDIQFEIRGGKADGDNVVYVVKPVTTDWTKVSIEHTAIGLESSVGGNILTFDLNNANHTEYWIDDLSVTQVVELVEESSDEDKALLSNAMQAWITGCVDHFKGDVKAWDVVNEPMADGASGLRNKANSDGASGPDIYFYSDVLGRDYALKAFLYAEAADPDALLFINDYNLESNPAKLDSLIAFVGELKAKGAKIDGIGTQMHIYDPKTYGTIREMFKKLADTGLLVKISELDVKCNLNGNTSLTPMDSEFQAAMYEYVIKTYLEVVPKEQQYGITIWGVNDGATWIKPTGDKYFFPLPWNDDFTRKPAYNAIYKAME